MQWENVLLFINRITVGTADPVIGKDIGFYLFSLPLLEILRGYLNSMLLATLLVTLAIYYIRGGIAINPAWPDNCPAGPLASGTPAGPLLLYHSRRFLSGRVQGCCTATKVPSMVLAMLMSMSG